MRGSATTLDFQCTSLNTIGNVELTNRMKRELKTEHEWLGKVNSQALQSALVMTPRYNCGTTHTARRSGITNMYLTHKYTILQMMHVSGHKTQKTFMDYIKLSSDEIADEIDAIANGAKADVF